MVKHLFTAHPASVDETYFEHLGVALSFSLKLFAGALVALVHAFFPFLFVKTGSAVIADLHDRMIAGRNRKAAKGRVITG